MTEICRPRLFCRTSMVQNRLIRHFRVDCSHRHLATLPLSNERTLARDGRFLLSTTPKRFRSETRLFRFFSDSKTLQAKTTRDPIEVTSSNDLSGQLSSDDGAVSDNNDSFALFLDTFPQTIHQNVNDVIFKVDSTKKSLQKRWKRILEIEKERYRRRNRIMLNNKNRESIKPSIEKLWEEAFRRSGYCIVPKSCEEEGNGELAIDGNEKVSQLLEFDERDESSYDIHLSPIFRSKINHQYLIDSETPLPIGREEDYKYLQSLEVQPLILKSKTDNEEKKEYKIDAQKAILESISLLIAMSPEDWRKYDSSVHSTVERNMVIDEISDEESGIEMHEKQKLVGDYTNLNQIHENMTKTRHFLRHVMKQKYVLTTSLVNLLLAHLVTSTEIENQEIGDRCLQVFEEMKMSAESGQYECGPDSTTYRILILAFSRRFHGIGEAVKISQEMIEDSSIDINPELLNEALRACRAKTELSVASSLINSALSNQRVTINAGSCMIYTDMLKTRKLDKEAIGLFSRIKKANLLSQDGEDDYLISLCQWPQRSRRGDIRDLSSFWADILHILEGKTFSQKPPSIRVWIMFLEGVYDSAKNDDSLWNMVAGATRTVLDSYPRSFVGRKLMTMGLDASSHAQDPELVSLILKRLTDVPSTSNISSDLETIKRPEKVPLRALMNSLKICLKSSDAKSAESIRDSLDRIGDAYPHQAKSELYSLVLKCHAKVNDAESAKRDLDMMIANNMKPSEELYSEVLRAMAAAGRYQDMEELFQSMQAEEEDGIEAGISSYDSVLFARIEEKSWDGVFSLYDQMKANGIKPSARTVKGLIIANDQTGGSESVSLALQSLLSCKAQFDESAFRLASETLFEEVDENLDEFRKNIREIGEQNKHLRVASLDLVRSIRSAETVSSRPEHMRESKYETQHSGEDAWRLATSHLLVFVQAWLENSDGVEQNYEE